MIDFPTKAKNTGFNLYYFRISLIGLLTEQKQRFEECFNLYYFRISLIEPIFWLIFTLLRKFNGITQTRIPLRKKYQLLFNEPYSQDFL